MNLASRVWVYQADRELAILEIKEVKEILKSFVERWTAHNQQLKATYEIKYNRFIVLIVDETQAGASGCSIDKSVHLMKTLEEKFQINLFDRFNIAYKTNNRVFSANKLGFENLIAEGVIDQNTTVFNNLVDTYQAYLGNWETTFKNSWHDRVFTLKPAF
jgi:hypothetical protein